MTRNNIPNGTIVYRNNNKNDLDFVPPGTGGKIVGYDGDFADDSPFLVMWDLEEPVYDSLDWWYDAEDFSLTPLDPEVNA